MIERTTAHPLYGFIDESGEPGIQKSENDYFIVSMLIFYNLEKVKKCSNAISRFKLREGLGEEYELHHTRDPKHIRRAFLENIPNLDFNYAYVAIKKNSFKNFASYNNMANNIVSLLRACAGDNIKVKMDRNPVLCRHLKNKAKQSGVNIGFKEIESRGNNLVQLADYIAAATARVVRKRTADTLYTAFNYKCIGSIILK